jgi:hypothetical protein
MRIDKTRCDDACVGFNIVTSFGEGHYRFHLSGFICYKHMFMVEKFKSIENLIGAKLAVFHQSK